VQAVERALDAKAEAVAREQMEAEPVDFEPTTFSVSLMEPFLAGAKPNVRIAVHGRAITGAVGPAPWRVARRAGAGGHHPLASNADVSRDARSAGVIGRGWE
jgi:hypothetical protein